MNTGTAILTADKCVSFHARNTPQKTALSDGRRALNYAELDGRIDLVVKLLGALGLHKGDRVGVFLKNRIEWAELLLGCARSGVICVPVNSRFVDSEIVHVLTHSGARALITEDSLVSRLDAARGQLAAIPGDRWLSIGGAASAGYGIYEDALAAAVNRPLATVEVLETDCWYLGYTSGTTGRPKAVIVNHRSRIFSACYAAIEFGVSDRDKTWLTMPLFHSNGIFFLLFLFYVGGTAYVAQEFEAEQTLQALSAHGITVVSMVPTMYALILALPDHVKAKYQLESLRVTISSSAPLLAKTKDEMLAFFPGASIYEFYGSTEASFVTCLKPRDQLRKLRSVGQPFFGTEVRLLDPQGVEVAPGEVGELWSRSAMQTFDGYEGDAEATRAAFTDGGWFSAGDMATRDEEGYFYIVDRKKDLIITGGENVYPTELEDVIARHPAVDEVAIVGLPDPIWGESVGAVIRLREGQSLALEELRSWAKERMADYKCPRQLHLWSELPKGPTGKLLRKVIREKLGQR